MELSWIKWVFCVIILQATFMLSKSSSGHDDVVVKADNYGRGRGACPEGYHTYDSPTERQCYYLHHANVTWPEAFSYCKTFGSHAAKVDTQGKHKFLANIAKSARGPFPLPGFWLAASDAIIEGRWVWSEDSSNMTYAPWSPGNPHDVIGQDCAAMWRSDGYTFVDLSCSFILHPICEIDIYSDFP